MPVQLLWAQRCWLCDGPAAEWGNRLKAIPDFPGHASLHRHTGACAIAVRYGAYLRSIPPSHRFGDYVHCTGRVVNIFFKRLLHMSLFKCLLNREMHLKFGSAGALWHGYLGPWMFMLDPCM